MNFFTPRIILVLSLLVGFGAILWMSYLYAKPFVRRIGLVLFVLLVGTLAVTRASMQGGFKLGVDLVGGTILVYEVDEDKLQQQREEALRTNRKFDEPDPSNMAKYLKERIDPVDLLNVTIRPVGKTRFEIILPIRQTEVNAAAWAELIEKVRTKPEWQAYLKDADLNVPAGQQRELIARLYRILNWEALKQKLRDKYKDKSLPATVFDVPQGEPQKLVDALKEPTGATPEDLRKFIDENSQTYSLKEIEKVIETYSPEAGRKNVTGEEIQKIKDLIAQQGSLEFRIVANRHRDGAAFRAAEDYFKGKENEAKRKEDLQRAAQAGLPPPAPVLGEGDASITYSWVEVGRSERQHLGLSNSTKTGQRWQDLAKARDQGLPHVIEYPAGGGRNESNKGTTSMMLWSRKCENLRLNPDERIDKAFDYFMLIRNPASPELAVTGKNIIHAQVSDSSVMQGEGAAVEFVFNAAGGRLFGQVTSENLPQGKEPSMLFSALAILLDGYVVSAPSLNSAIHDRGQITGLGNIEEARRLAQILRSGQLPATLKPQPVSENTIGATLGADTIQKGVWSVGAAFVIVMAFMVVYYRFAGLVACIALMANLLLTVAFMVIVNATFTLPGLAGLVLTLGMAVDANVLIYERLREERERGASLLLALRNGYDRAFPTILDTHLTSIFTAIVLYAVGNDQLKGFGISLTAGLVISLFTSLYVTRLLFDLWQYRGWLTKLSMFQGLTNFLHSHYIDFMRVRHIWFTITVVLTVLGLGIFLIRGPKGLNIDFVGGTAYGGQLDQPLEMKDLRRLLGEKHQDDRLAVQSVRQEGDDIRLYTIAFNDGTKQIVALSNDPASGGTTADREAVVTKRASALPDWSVEQIFPKYATGAAAQAENSNADASRYFTVRSTEMEASLVQLAVNRLLWENGKSLLKQVSMEPPKIEGKHATLTFSAPASPGYLKRLLEQVFQAEGIRGETSPFELHGIGQDTDGHFQTMSLDVASQQVTPEKLDSILKRARTELANWPLPERLENFDAQLAAETSQRALYAILASWAAILLYLWFRFGNWTFGAAAVLCLVHDLCFTLGAIAFCHYLATWGPVSGFAHLLGIEDFKIDLPAVAALLTLVGYSVNDTIVVFDRIREVRGKNPVLTEKMINDSVNQTLSRTLLASLTVWLVVIVLYWFGGEGVHLFAFVMVVGVIVGTYSSIYIASPLLLMFGEGTPRTARDRARTPAPEGVAV